MRDETIERRNLVVKLLHRAQRTGGWTIDELASSIESETRDRKPSRRTLQRDIEYLERQGHDVERSRHGRHVRFLLNGTEKSPELRISDIQLLALAIAMETLKSLQGTSFWRGLRSYWRQTLERAPARTREHFEKRRQQVIVRGTPAKSYAEQGGILSTLFDAQLSHREVEIHYASPVSASDETKPRVIRPYSMAFYSGSIFIVAEDAALEEFRQFKLDRIVRAARCNTYFEPRGDFNPQEYFEHSLSTYTRHDEQPVTARVRLSRRIVQHVREQPWHADQQLRKLKSGQYDLLLPSVYGTEVISKVLGYQGDAVILSPKRLCDQVRDKLTTMVRAYGRSKGTT